MEEKNVGCFDLPYERFMRFGAENLTEKELLAIILRTGTREHSAIQVAEEVLALARYPREGLLGLYDLTLEDLMSVRGIGEVKAVRLKCLTEFSKRISQAKAKEVLCFQNSQSVAEYYMEQLRHRDTECVYLLNLDNKGRMLSDKRLSDGSVRMSLISPREIFLCAISYHAVGILLVHNHPSGDPTPSKSDVSLTKNVHTIGEMMNIPLTDHIIIGDNRYISFREEGYI